MPPPHLGEDVVLLVALDPRDPERLAAEAHASSCEACAAALEEARSVLVQLDAQAVPAPTEEALARAKTAVLRELDWPEEPATTDRLLSWGTGAAVAFAFVALALAAKHPSGEGRVWREAGAAAVLAVAGAVLATRHGKRARALVCATGLALVAGSARGQSLGPLVGLKCAALELATAALPLAVASWWAVSRRTTPSASSLGAYAAAGALAGDAALHLSCPERLGAPHALVFHVGGIVLAAALGAWLWGPLARRAARAT